MIESERAQLDRIDDAIVQLFLQRMDVVDAIGAYKRMHHIESCDPQREKALLERVKALAPKERQLGVEELFSALLKVSKAEQNRKNRNIVLIGMPGSGKSAVANLLGTQLGRPVFSTDAEVEARANCTIETIFAKQGEAAFREMERAVISECAACWGSVIATGGGAVLSAENRAVLRQNSRIYYLQRPLCALDTAGRPLSQGAGALERLYQERHGLYQSFSDVQMEMDDAFSVTAERIAAEFFAAFA